MRPTISAFVEAGASGSVTFSAPLLVGDNVKSRSSHQSNSVTLFIPAALNHDALPNGTKKWQLGCFFEIAFTVGNDK